MFHADFLSDVRRRALRKGLWFRALDRVERGIVEISSRGFDEVKSLELVKILVSILAKLRDASKSPFIKHLESVGIDKARNLVEQACRFGCKEAISWLQDVGFAYYIGFMDFYRQPGWGV